MGNKNSEKRWFHALSASYLSGTTLEICLNDAWSSKKGMASFCYIKKKKEETRDVRKLTQGHMEHKRRLEY